MGSGEAEGWKIVATGTPFPPRHRPCKRTIRSASTPTKQRKNQKSLKEKKRRATRPYGLTVLLEKWSAAGNESSTARKMAKAQPKIHGFIRKKMGTASCVRGKKEEVPFPPRIFYRPRREGAQRPSPLPSSLSLFHGLPHSDHCRLPSFPA